MKTLYRIITLPLLALSFSACQGFLSWDEDYGSEEPLQVEITEVTPLNGGVSIKYVMPNQENLLGVKGVYYLTNDPDCKEVFASSYSNEIIIRGFGDENEHTVNVITMHKNKKESAPVPVTFKPLKPAIFPIAESVEMDSTFGGVVMTWDNLYEDDIAIGLYLFDKEKNDFTLYRNIFSSAQKGEFTFRGLDAVEYEFKAVVRDRWMNETETTSIRITPLFEERIIGKDENGTRYFFHYGYEDKSTFERGEFGATYNFGAEFYTLVDGEMWNPWGNYFDTVLGGYKMKAYVPDWSIEPDTYTPEPAYLTMDLTRTQKLSRIVLWQRNLAPKNVMFPLHMEIWGTDKFPTEEEIDSDGSRLENLRYWTAWTEIDATDKWKEHFVKLADYTLEFPSGVDPRVAVGNPALFTPEDFDFMKWGYTIEMDMANAHVPVRYIRFVMKEDARGYRLNQLNWAEIEIYGAYVD